MIAYFLIIVGLAGGQPHSQVVVVTDSLDACTTVLVEVDKELERRKVAAAGACVAVDLGGESV